VVDQVLKHSHGQRVGRYVCPHPLHRLLPGELSSGKHGLLFAVVNESAFEPLPPIQAVTECGDRAAQKLYQLLYGNHFARAKRPNGERFVSRIDYGSPLQIVYKFADSDF
jgi:hypothetical protein